MSVRVMRSKQDYLEARRRLDERRLSLYRGDWFTRWRINRGIGQVQIGDLRKSWDVLKAAEFIEQHVAKDAAVLDLGAFSSEIGGVLHKIGYSNVTGIDLDPRVERGPFPKSIRYVVGDFLHTPFADQSYRAITAMSAIEHGHHADALFAEVNRLLQPGGYLLGSTDYWPAKIDTSQITMFGMSWTIFSADELRRLFAEAEKHGLRLVGDAQYDAGDPVVETRDLKYTFAWFVLQKAV